MDAADVIRRSEVNQVDVLTSLLRLFNENPDNFISWFLTVDETWLQHFNPESKMQSMALKHLQESFTLSRRHAKLERLYSGTLEEFHWLTILNMAAPSQESTTLVWSEKLGRHWRKRDEESCVTECCFTRTTHLLTRHLKHWLPSEMSDSNYSLTHCIRQTWSQATFICFLNWRNSWKDADLLTIRTISAWLMAGWKTKIKNSSTVESELWRNAWQSAFQLKETMLKSDKIWRAYLMVNCVRLRTFWTPLVVM